MSWKSKLTRLLKLERATETAERFVGSPRFYDCLAHSLEPNPPELTAEEVADFARHLGECDRLAGADPMELLAEEERKAAIALAQRAAEPQPAPQQE